MKKRILSALLALSMIFSIIPNSIGGGLTASAADTPTIPKGGTTYDDATKTYTGDSSNKIVDKIEIKFENGQLTKFDVSIPAGSRHNSNGQLYALILPIGNYTVTGAQAEYFPTYSDWTNGLFADTDMETLVTNIQSGASATENLSLMFPFFYAHVDGQTNHANQGEVTNLLQYSVIPGPEENVTLTADSIRTAFETAAEDGSSLSDVTKDIPIAIFIATSNYNVTNSLDAMFVYQTTFDSTASSVTIPGEEVSPPSGKTVTELTVDIPKIEFDKELTAPQNSDITANDGANVSINGDITYTPDGTSTAPKVALGGDGYTVSFPVTLSDASDKFGDTVTAKPASFGDDYGSSGYTPTVEFSKTDDTKGTITIHYPAIKVSSLTLRNPNEDENITQEANTYDLTKGSMEVTLSDGELKTYNPTNNPDWLKVDGTDCTVAAGQVSEIKSTGSSVHVKVDADLTANSMAIDKTWITFTVKTVTTISEINLELTMPTVGDTPVQGKDGSTTTAGVDATVDDWLAQGGGSVGDANHFNYGSTYKVQFKLNPEDDNYKFADTLTVNLSAKGDSRSNVDTFTESQTVTDVDSGDTYVQFDVTMLSAPRVEDVVYDYYEGKDLTLTLTPDLIGTVDKLTIGGQELTSDTDYHFTGSNTITITEAKAKDLVKQLLYSGSEPTAPNATGQQVTAAIDIQYSGSDITKNITLKNTTPYLTVEKTTNGTITVTQTDNDDLNYSEQSGGATLALKKTGEVTVQANESGTYKFKEWSDTTTDTVYQTSGGKTTNPARFTPAESTSYTVGATFEGPIEMTVVANGDTVTSVQEQGGSLVSEESGKYKIYPDKKYVVTVTPDTDHKFGNPAWSATTTLSDAEDGGQSSGARTYTFTAPESEFTLTANLELNFKKLKVTQTGGDDSNVTVQSQNNSITKDGDGTYHVLPSHGDITITATATKEKKIISFTGESSTNSKTVSRTLTNDDITDGQEITITFADKVKPEWDAGTKDEGATHQVGMGRDNFVYKHTTTSDYTLESAQVTNERGEVQGTISVVGDTITITPEILDALAPGDYTVTFKFNDILDSTNDEWDYTIPVRKFKVIGAPEVQSVTLPSDKEHGDALGTVKFTLDDGSEYTYTATNDGGSWDKTTPTNIMVNVTSSGSQPKVSSAITLDEFITKYVAGNKIVRFNKKSTDTDLTALLCNGDTVAFGTNGTNYKTATLTVTQKKVKLTVTNSELDKDYDGTADVKDVLTWTAVDAPITEDRDALGTSFNSPTDCFTVAGTYQGGAGASTDNKTIQFNVTPDNDGHPDIANYNITADNKQGKINKKEIHVNGSNFTVPQAEYDDVDKHSGASMDEFLKNSNDLVEADRETGIHVTYSYKYDDVGGTQVTIEDVVADNYTIIVDGKATGERKKRTVSRIDVEPLNTVGEGTNTYYSTDHPDAKITIVYSSGDPEEYANIAAAKAEGSKIQSVQWGDSATAGTTDVDTNEGVTVTANNNKYIVVTLKDDATEGAVKTGSVQIKVNPIPVTVTVNAEKISKPYDGDDSFNQGEGDTVTSAFSYTYAVDTTGMDGDHQTKYNETVSSAGLSVSGVTVQFAQKDAYSATYGGATQYEDVAKATDGSFSNAEYTVSQTVSHITAAEISKLAITVDQIDYIKPVRVGAAGVRVGKAVVADAADTSADYKAVAKLNPDHAIAGTDGVLFDITYEYDNTSVSTENNAAEVTLKSIKLADATTNTQNKNYTFTNLDASDAASVQGRGTVKDVEISNINLTLPPALNPNVSSGMGQITYGDANYKFNQSGDTAGYNGLTIDVVYADGTVKYVWDSTHSHWTITDPDVTTGDIYADYDKKPFTLTWVFGGAGDTYDADTLGVITSLTDLQKGITWTYPKSGRTLQATIGVKTGSKQVSVSQKKISVDVQYQGDTTHVPEKNYDYTIDLKPALDAAHWTFAPQDVATGDEDLTVTFNGGADHKVTYTDANAGDNIDLHFGGSFGNHIEESDWTIGGLSGVDADERAKSYEISELTGVSKGNIKPRPITLTAIKKIPAVAQFTNHIEAEGKATSGATDATYTSTAEFAAATGDDAQGTGTGVLVAEAATISFKYHYENTDEAANPATLANGLKISEITLLNNNYKFDPDPNESLETLTREGAITAAQAQGIDIKAPTMFTDSQTRNAVQYGDKFNYRGIEVTIHYASGIDAKYTLPESDTDAFTDGAIAHWMEQIGSGKANMVEASAVPFTLSCGHAEGGAPTPHKQGDIIDYVDESGDTGGGLTVTVKGQPTVTDTSEFLVVYARQVNVTAAPASTITKQYDGTVKYTSTTDGAITYTLTPEKTKYTDGSYSLPGTVSATAADNDITYNSKNATDSIGGAQKVNITNIKLSDTAGNPDKYALKNKSASASATITKRSVTVQQVHNVTPIVQGTSNYTGNDLAVTTAADADKPYAVVDGAVESETLSFTVDYSYNTPKVKSEKDQAPVTISDVQATNDTALNYTVTANSVTGTGTVNAASYSVEVTNPTQFDSGYTFDEGGLVVDGLTVTVKNTDPNATDDTTTYYAVNNGGVIEWHKDNASGDVVPDPPFTLQWSDTKGGADTNVTPGMKLPPEKYNGATLTATLKTANPDGNAPSAGGGKVTVNKKKISKVTASGTGIEKEYDGNTDVSQDITYAIAEGETIEGTEPTLTPTAKAQYESKDVNDNIAIKFTLTNGEDTSDPNYEFADVVNIEDLTGKITKRTVKVTDVYVPGITANSAEPQPTVNVTDAKAVTTSGGALTSKQVRANNFVTGEDAYFTFSYTITYRDGDARGTSGAENPVFVTMSGNKCEETADAAEHNVKLSNYEIQWTDVEAKSRKSEEASGSTDWKTLQEAQPGANRSDYLLGNVAADTYEEVSPPTDAGNKITSEVNPHKHGDKLDLTGLTINVTSKAYGELEYKIAGEAGAQYWTRDGSSEVTLPDGIAVHIGNIPITTKADLENLQAHYTNMNGKDIILEVTGQPAQTSANKVVVKQADLHVTANETTYDKYYDGTKTVTGFTLTPTDTDLVTFTKESRKDVVTVTGTAQYASADVAGSAAAPTAQNITFDLTAGGDDAGNYILVPPAGVTGTIKPRKVVVSSLGAEVKAEPVEFKAATTNGTVTASGSRTSAPDKYIYDGDTVTEGTWPPGVEAPEITITYDYGNLASTRTGAVNIAKSGSNGDSFSMEFSAATNNFVLDYDAVTTLPGTVTRAAITSIAITKTQTAYYYGDKLTDAELDDLEITVNGNDTFKYYDSASGAVDPKFDNYNLELVVTNNTTPVTDRDNTVLKAGTATVQVKDKDGTQASNTVDLTVSKRKLIVKAAASINKEYDGTPAATVTGLTVAPEVEQVGDGYGLAEVDKALVAGDYGTVFTVTAADGALYKQGENSVKNACVGDTSYDITADVSFTANADIPTDQYELELKDVKGKITPKPVTLTPKLEQNYYLDNTNISISEAPYNAETFVDGEQSRYTFTYTIKLSASKHNAASTYTISAANASGDNAYKSNTVSDGDDRYEWEIKTTDDTNFPLTNYTFTKGDASVTIKNRSVVSATILEDPKQPDNIMKKTYSSGDGIDYKGLTVRVVYTDTAGNVSIDYTYGKNWLSSFKIVLEDGVADAPAQGTPLTTADSGKKFKVKITDTITTSNATSEITVNPKKLTVTAEQSETASREYDGTADASMFVTYKLVDAPAGITLNLTNTASAVFTGVNPSYAGENKPISITASNSSFTLQGDGAAGYEVEWQAPATALTGKVTKLDISIKSLPLLRAAQNSDATETVDVSTSGQIIGTEDRTTVVLNDTDGSAAKMPEADKRAFRASWTATFPVTVLTKTENLDTPENLTFKDSAYPVVTNESGSDELFTANYNFTWPVPRGIIVPAAIQITDSTASPARSTHGDKLNLGGLKFTVEYHSTVNYTVTFQNVDGQWQKKDANDHDFVNIDASALSDTYGVTLSWEGTRTIINPNGTDYANYANNGKTIVISVPLHNGRGGYATANTGAVTILRRPIYAFVRKQRSGSDIEINKQYDGNNLANPSGLEFEFYDYTGTGNGNDAETNADFEKYTNPFPEENIKIDVPAEGTAATYNQLRAEYLGGDNASYKLSDGGAWVACNMEGKDVKRDGSGNVVPKTIQLSNLHLTGAGSGNYQLANADTWNLNAVDSDFDRYHPTVSKDVLDEKNQLKGTISAKPLSITVTSVPSIAKNSAGGEKTVDLTESNYTVSGKVDGDTLSNIKLTAKYSDQNAVGGQETEISMSGTQAGYPELNYNITSSPAKVNGMVNDKGISKVEITAQPTDREYTHGDILDLSGMVVKVTYSDSSYNVYTYDGDNNSTLPWKLQRYESSGSALGEAENVGSIQDVTLTWNGNRAVETKYNSENAAMIYSATDMGYTGNGDPRSTKIKVTPTIPETPESTDYAAAAESDAITVAKRQIALKIDGTLTKMYNGSTSLTPNSYVVGSERVEGDKLTVTVVDGVTQGALPTTLDVTFDKAGAIANAQAFSLKSKDSKPDSYAGEKNIDVTLSQLRSYITCVKGGTADSYKMPSSGSFIINNASGEIVPRPLVITAKSQADLPRLDLNTDTPDEPGGTTYTKKLIKPDNITVEGPGGNVGAAIQGIMPYDGQDEVEVDWSIIFDIASIDKNSAAQAPITFTAGSLKPAHAENAEYVVANYTPTFDSNSITNGNVTPLAAAKDITATKPSKSEYNHGDHLDLTGMTVTVTKGDNTTETYKYEDGSWKKDDGTTVTDDELPFELYWSAGTDIAEDPANEAAQNDELSLTEPKNGATGNDGEDKTFHLSVKSKSDPTKHAEVNITVSRLQLKLFVSGTATKVYDKTDKLVKIADDASNTYAITAVLKPAGATDAVVTLDNVDALVTAGTIKYGATASNPNASYVGSSEDDTKTITVDLAGLGVTLTDDNAKIYKLPASAETDIDVSGVTQADITKKPITLAVTEDTLAPFTWNAASPTRKLDATEYDVYAGANVTAGASIKQFLTDDSVGVDWSIEYSDVTFNPNNATIKTTASELTGAAKDNYDATWILPPNTSKVLSSTAPQITVTKQPTVPENPEYGDKPDWNGFEYEVKKPDGTTTKHKWDNENKKWVEDTTYTKPDDDTKFKWSDNTEVGPDDFKDITDKKLDVGDNKLTVTVPNGDDPITGNTNTFTASKRKITAKVTGLEDKVYDGTTAATGTPSVTFENVADGDTITAANPSVEFEDKNVAVDSSGNVTTKRVVVKGVTIPDTLAGKYEIVNDPAGTDGITAESNAKITPREIKVVIKAPSIKTDISDSAKTISKTGIGYSENAAEDKYTLAENTTLAAGDTVTLKYSGTYQDITTGTKTTANKTTSAERDAVFKFTQAPAIEDTQLANNYTLMYDITYEVTSSGSTSSGGGGGGGGGGNSLTIYYELEDGKKGEIAPSKIEVPLGTDPTDLMAEIKYKLNDMTIVWSSDNEKVATVDENGIVTYVGEGQATITAASKQNKQLKDTVKVTVTKGTASTTPTPSPTPTPDYENNKTDSLITGEMLNPYIVGYDDYVFGPELPISREELSAIFARLIANSIYMDKEYDTSFPDVPETWSKTYIGYLEGFNVVTGYEDGTFRPHNYITRAEMAVMMAKAEGYDISGTMDASELDFPDVDQGYSTWAVKAIKILTDKGIMQGYTDGTFRPGQPITRAETVATVNRVLADMEVADIEILPSDVTDAHWAYNDIVFAMNHRVLKDAAADPNKFIWSEQFDENMVKTNGNTAGTANNTPSEDNTSDGGADAPADSDQAGTTE